MVILHDICEKASRKAHNAIDQKMVEGQTSQMSVRLWQVLHAQKQGQSPPTEHKKKVRTQTKLNKQMAVSAENMYAITQKN